MKKYNIPFSPPDISEAEINEVCDTLRSGWITTGPKTKLLEQKLSAYTNTNKTVCLNSATAALEMTLRVLKIQAGDEVIVPAMTYTASCSVIRHVNATPVMVDIQKNHFEMNYDLLEAAINEKTKAIIVVDLCGIPCDYDRIYRIIEKKQALFQPNSEYQAKLGRIALISDAAHALGSEYKNQKVGSVADFTAFSFHAVKNFTTAEGGSVTWKANPNFDDEALYREFQIYSLHGQTKDALSKMKAGAWEYDILIPGYKCNMTDIMASLGLVQLQRYPTLLKRRHEIVAKYNQAFDNSDVTYLKHVATDYTSCCHLYITHIPNATLQERNLIIEKLGELGISTNVHYKPLPLLSAYQEYGIENYPNAYNYYENEITLPLHTQMSDEDVDNVIKEYLNVINEVMKR